MATTTKKAAKAAIPEKKSVTPELICEVLRGEWGDEKERSAKLKAAGYAPSVVTKKIKALKEIANAIKPAMDAAGDYFVCLTYFTE